jgi:sugar phosphate isomerase/epimerase
MIPRIQIAFFEKTKNALQSDNELYSNLNEQRIKQFLKGTMKSENIQIGFNLNFQWLKGRSFSSVIDPLIAAGLSVIEVHLDFRFPQIADHLEYLCKQAANSGLGISFHGPYLDPPFMVGFARENKLALKSQWQPVADLINRYTSTNLIRTEMVLHGSHGPDADMSNLLDDTVQISQWILEQCPELFIGIENLPTPRNPSNLVKFGEDRDSVLKVVNQVDHPRCGITWDMGHCVRNHILDLPSQEWVKKVVHVHVHDVDEARQDHWPLNIGRTPYLDWIKYLIANNFCGTITAELTGDLYRDWTQDYIDAQLLATIQKIKEAIC